MNNEHVETESNDFTSSRLCDCTPCDDFYIKRDESSSGEDDFEKILPQIAEEDGTQQEETTETVATNNKEEEAKSDICEASTTEDIESGEDKDTGGHDSKDKTTNARTKSGETKLDEIKARLQPLRDQVNWVEENADKFKPEEIDDMLTRTQESLWAFNRIHQFLLGVKIGRVCP